MKDIKVRFCRHKCQSRKNSLLFLKIFFHPSLTFALKVKFSGLDANATVTKYPLGTHLWRVSGGDGCGSEGYSSKLTISTCNDTQFSCDDGLCVDMNTR